MSRAFPHLQVGIDFQYRGGVSDQDHRRIPRSTIAVSSVEARGGHTLFDIRSRINLMTNWSEHRIDLSRLQLDPRRSVAKSGLATRRTWFPGMAAEMQPRLRHANNGFVRSANSHCIVHSRQGLCAGPQLLGVPSLQVARRTSQDLELDSTNLGSRGLDVYLGVQKDLSA